MRVLICLLVGFIAPGQALAWNDSGHMLVARMVYAALPTVKQQQLNRLLRAHPRFEEDFVRPMPRRLRGSKHAAEWQFAHAGVWPDYARQFDDVRSGSDREALVERYQHRRWHYVNVDLRVDSSGRYLKEDPATQLASLRDGSTDGENIVAALQQLSADWEIASAPERALALCWLLHLMADLHQPLHTTQLVAPGRLAAGDRGGNEIAVRVRGESARNLHGLWDGALGRSTRWKTLGKTLDDLNEVPGRAESTAIDFVAWVMEGRDAAREFAYTDPLRRQVARQSSEDKRPDFRPDAGYMNDMREQARQGMVMAASRTVRLLRKLDTQ